MWHRKNNNLYEIPEKPEKPERQKDQISMLWDAMYNHIPSILKEQNRRFKWQDIKINFILVFVGLILASLSIYIYPLIVSLFR